MAFTIIPKNKNEIKDKNIRKVFLKFKNDIINEPISLDSGKPREVKLHRAFQSDYSQKDLNYFLPEVKVYFGNGSRGNNGVYNRGLLFEDKIYKNIKPHFNKVVKTSTKHNRRPLGFSSSGPYIGNSEIQSIGFDVADIIIDDKDCLSLKYGKKVTLVNSGIKKLISKDDIQSEKIGSRFSEILDMFGVDNLPHFFDTYNMKCNRDRYIDNCPKYNKDKIQHFFRTGLGYGYWLVHGWSNKPPKSLYMDRRSLFKSTEVKSVKVIYPEIGKSKRFDIKVSTCYKEYTVTIRNKDGGVYPSHMMIDYNSK